MTAIRYKELLNWYVITLKLRETVEPRLPKKSTYVGEIVPNYEPRPPKSEWVISIEEKLAQGRHDNMPNSLAKLSIYRIPRHLKHGEEKAWVPQIVSLGPYHHGDEHLHHMEQHKWRCLHRILERCGQDIGLFLDSVKKVERKARACYEGRISMSRDKFVEMMVLNGCFAVEMFQGFVKGFEKLGYPPNDPVFSMRPSILQVQRDVIMLENQIPLFILDRLLSLQVGYTNQKEHVAKLAIQFFYPLMRKFRIDGKRLVFDPLFYPAKVHCLEAFRRSCLHLGPKRPKTRSQWQSREQLTRCLTDLREAGIEIRPDFWRLFGDIEFNDGILQIPYLEIHEGTRSLFLNWIAFEQSHFDCSNYVTSYVIFMHDLIKSPEDVRYLCNHDITSHCLESNAQVVDLFNRLCQEVAFNFEDSYLQQLHNDLHKYYHFKSISFNDDDPPSDTCSPMTRYFSPLLRILLRNILTRKWNAFVTRKWNAFVTRKWNAWAAILKSKYFDNPWSNISLIAATALLVLTFMQTFYTAYAYYNLRS
ncbi:hypothetical protein BT93_C1153 [Corymbia citriodora subsp. variegata]|nr:hypothetical protein BT93_C1153 [Corymbia citriodora subsp. variegata]